MERKSFLKSLGLASAGAFIPFKNALAGNDNVDIPVACTLIPSETQGPFPLDLTANSYYYRSDITEGKTGAPLTLKMKIIGADNCEAMSNVRVNVWMCDKDGSYSGYSIANGNTTDEIGETFLRGYQITDANGEVEFTTILPGWYNGRICHIHFQVYVSTSYSVVSQLTFDINTKNDIYAAFPGLYTKGADPMTLAQDNIFSDGYQYQVATLSGDINNGYESYLEVTVQGSGTTGVGHIEKENAKRFSLGQNFPNPHSGNTTIPFTLHISSVVSFDIYDIQGRKLTTLEMGKLSKGNHEMKVDLAALNLPTGNYVYQIQVQNNDGIYRAYKLMTAAK